MGKSNEALIIVVMANTKIILHYLAPQLDYGYTKSMFFDVLIFINRSREIYHSGFSLSKPWASERDCPF